MAEKTEKATPKKLRDARKKGQVAKAQDLPSAITFIVSISMVVILSSYIYQQISNFMLGAFRMAPFEHINVQAGPLLRQAFDVIFAASLPVMGLVTAVGVVANFLVVGPVFSVEVFKPSFKKFNVVENVKQKFKMKTLVELIKSVLKILISGIIIYWTMHSNLKDIVMTVALPFIYTANVFEIFLIQVVIRVGIFFLAIAIFDLIYQRRVFAKEMMMEKFEVKQEYKDTEGSPEIKSRRRQLFQEIAYDEAGPSAVRRAKAVITNPTHIAVAIGYEPEKYPAPYVLTMGTGTRAEHIIAVALKFNVPVMRNVPLARQLFETGKIMEYIPKETYEAVAEILRWIASLEEENE